MSDVTIIQPTRVQLSEEVPALEIRLGGTPRGVVILLADETAPEIEIVESMNTFAAEGFESIAPTSAPGFASLAEARARSNGWDGDQIGVVGIGGGATSAFALARERQLGAVVSLSPDLDLVEIGNAPGLRTPWLGMFGADADDITAAEIARLRRVLDGASDVYGQVVVYPGVGADFHRRPVDGVTFAASYDGWQRTVEWLLARVAPRLTPLAIAWRERQAAAG